jgi:hypothetical protein
VNEFPEHVVNIERKLWTNNAVQYKDNLSEDCLLVFPETGVINRDLAVEAIRKENKEGRKWAEVHFDEMSRLRLTHEVALLNYRVTARWEHEQSAITALATSLYVKRDSMWKLTFHQQTPLTQESRHVEHDDARKQ